MTAERVLKPDLRERGRKRAVRALTISVRSISRRELEAGRELYPESEHGARPKTRGDCAQAARPCPFVSCKHHLYLDVSSQTGAIKLNFPDIEVWEMAESCVLDVADRGGATLEEVGALMNLTRERTRQLEARSLAVIAGHWDPGE